MTRYKAEGKPHRIIKEPEVFAQLIYNADECDMSWAIWHSQKGYILLRSDGTVEHRTFAKE